MYAERNSLVSWVLVSFYLKIQMSVLSKSNDGSDWQLTSFAAGFFHFYSELPNMLTPLLPPGFVGNR